MKKQAVILSGTVLFLIITTTMSYFILKEDSKSVFLELLPMIFGVLAFFVVDRFTVWAFLSEVQERQKIIETSKAIRQMTVEEGNELIESLVGLTQTIRNTVFYTSAPGAYLEEKTTIVANFIFRNQVDWQEIVYWPERTKMIRFKMRAMAGLSKGQYNVWLLDQKLVNKNHLACEFVTMELKDGRSLVMFGWGDEPGSAYNGLVFLSEDQRVAQIFIDHFWRLKDLGVQLVPTP
jgi:hypothetical protein